MNKPLDKAGQRARAIALRARIVEQAGDISRPLTEYFLKAYGESAPSVIAGYYPVRGEPDVRPLLAALHAKGWTTALPAPVSPTEPMVFRAWANDDPLTIGRYSIPQPTDLAEIVLPDIVLVPLLAYDRRGHRLGYGAGYYDRVLAKLRSLENISAVGVAYAGQQVDVLPEEAHDELLDAVLTEDGFRKFERDGT